MKRLQLRKILLLTGLITILAAPAAHAARISVLGVGNLGTVKTTGEAVADKAKLGMGGGLTFEFPLGSRVGLELGGLYSPRKSTDGGTGLEVTTTAIEFPVLFNFWFNRYLALAAGGFYSMAMGKVKVATLEFDYDTIGFKKSDYGVQGGLRINLPLGSTAAFRVQGNYQLGLADLNSVAVTGVTSKTSNIQMFAGITFGMK